MQKKAVVAIALGIAAVISLLYGIVTPPKGRVASKSDSAVMRKEEPDTSPQGPMRRVSRKHKRSEYKTWGRNPFSIAEGTTSGNLILNGIMWDKSNPKAMVNDAIVRKGDKLGGNVVVDIKPDRVVLNNGTDNFELKLKE